MTSPLDIAITQLGVQEATGQNDGIPATRYNYGEAKAWCAAFVVWCFAQAGIPLPGNKFKNASVQHLEDQLKAQGAYFANDHRFIPQPGDIVFFASRGASDRGPGRHVGIVDATPQIAGHFWSIEGNVSNAVKRCKHSVLHDDVVGFARWS